MRIDGLSKSIYYYSMSPSPLVVSVFYGTYFNYYTIVYLKVFFKKGFTLLQGS